MLPTASSVTQHREARQLIAGPAQIREGGELIGRAVDQSSTVIALPEKMVAPIIEESSSSFHSHVGPAGNIEARRLHPVAVPQRHGARAAVAQAARSFSGSGRTPAAGQSRRADRVEHLGHRRLALQRHVEIVEQPRVRDGDRRLLGEYSAMRPWRGSKGRTSVRFRLINPNMVRR